MPPAEEAAEAAALRLVQAGLRAARSDVRRSDGAAGAGGGRVRGVRGVRLRQPRRLLVQSERLGPPALLLGHEHVVVDGVHLAEVGEPHESVRLLQAAIDLAQERQVLVLEHHLAGARSSRSARSGGEGSGQLRSRHAEGRGL
eukprot:9351613-Pyramimonas_sp.AAC.1